MMLRSAFATSAFVILIATCGSSLAQESGPPSRPRTGLGAALSTTAGEATQTYEHKGRRDPFQPIEVIQPPPPDTRPHAVAAARLKGIVRGSASRVLIETPDGMGYILRVGDIFADGRLVEIGADRVVFTVSPRRGSTIDRIVLRLPDD